MRRVRLSQRAESDLGNIWSYTRAEFGDGQAELYLNALEDGMVLLLEHPEIGKPADHIKPGYRAYIKEKHVIYYTLSTDHIDVIGILHERMDPLAQLD